MAYKQLLRGFATGLILTLLVDSTGLKCLCFPTWAAFPFFLPHLMYSFNVRFVKTVFLQNGSLHMIEVLVYTCLYINIKWLLFFIPEMHIEHASYKREKAY